MAEFKFIKLKDITADPNQPRKFFEERSMDELKASIKTNGVLQPIMVRPLGAKYMLVCGERRFKASIAAGLKEIPAVIRHLADDEALEVQITENLQRKDVHPMEEGIAFAALAKKYTTEEISLRVGKSQAFVVKRIKLADLVSDAQELFFSNKIEMKHAQMLCRLDPSSQTEILKEVLPKNWKDPKVEILEWKIERMCEDNTERLDKAPFKTSDAKLYPEAGPCTKCPFNSANQPLLFDDLKGRHCTKPSCFQIKATRHEKQQLEAIAVDPNRFAVAGSGYLDDKEKAIIAGAKELGINVLDEKMYKRVDDDTDPGTWEEWATDYDFEDDPDAEAECKEEYEQHVKDCAENKEKLEAARKEGRIIDVYVLTGYSKGQTIPVELNKAVKAFMDASADDGDADSNAVLQEIAGIEMREARAKEFDREKIYQAAREQFTKDAPKEWDAETVVCMDQWRDNIEYANILRHEAESRIICGFLYESLEYGARNEFEDKYILNFFKPALNYVGKNDVIEYFRKINNPGDTAARLLQYLIAGKAFPINGSEFSSVTHAMSVDFAREHFSDALKTIELTYEEKAIQRQARVDARIKALRKKLNKPVEA